MPHGCNRLRWRTQMRTVAGCLHVHQRAARHRLVQPRADGNWRNQIVRALQDQGWRGDFGHIDSMIRKEGDLSEMLSDLRCGAKRGARHWLGVVVCVSVLAGVTRLPAVAQGADDLAALDAQIGELYQAGKYADATEIAKRSLALAESDSAPTTPMSAPRSTT